MSNCAIYIRFIIVIIIKCSCCGDVTAGYGCVTV